MWIPMFLLYSLPVSGALWAQRDVRGVRGRTITIDCHYEASYRSHQKYWCREWTHLCSVLVSTNGDHERKRRLSITDNPTAGIFTITMENLQTGDTGWYHCGISQPAIDPKFNVHLLVTEEPVSVPELRYLSPPNVSCLGGAVSVSCESAQGSLPIHYIWYEKTPFGDSWVSATNKLELHCQFFKDQHHQYFCESSNQLGTKRSEVIKVTVFSGGGEICRYVTEMNGKEPVSVPVFGFLSSPNASCHGGVVSLSCESAQGSLPIQYTWYEKTPTGDSKISDISKVDLHCQSFKHQNHQYYCIASNEHGTKCSEMLNVTVFNRSAMCRIVTEINGAGLEYVCHRYTTASTSTVNSEHHKISSNSSLRSKEIIVLSATGVLLTVLIIFLLFWIKCTNRESKNKRVDSRGNNETQDSELHEDSIIYADLQYPKTPAQLGNDQNEIVYSAVQFQSTSRAGHSVNREDNTTYANVKYQNCSSRNNRETASPGTPHNSAQAIYNTVAS